MEVAVPTPYADVAHLLRRAGFGGLPNEISALAQLDLEQIVDSLLDFSNAPAVVVPPLLMDTTATGWDRHFAFINWWFDRMRTTPAPLQDKMVLFWHGHFTSSLEKTSYENMWDQMQLFRNLGFGSFRDLTQAVAINPAMLQYLDGESNTKSSPNENFARESMELFTLGVNQYTQADVTAAAKAWSGYGLSTDKRAYVFTAAKHDTSDKTFFGVTRNWDGPEIIDEIILGQKSMVCARFIVTKLWTFFAYPKPEDVVIEALATAFAGSNFDIKTLLKTMFMRPEFFSIAARQMHVRSPVEFLVAMMRYAGIDASEAHLDRFTTSIGQIVLRPPNVAGWGTGRYWVSTSTMWTRANAARNAMWAARPKGLLGDSRNFSIQTAVQRALDAFGIDQPSLNTRSVMETAVYNERFANSRDENINLIQLAMLSPEFQIG